MTYSYGNFYDQSFFYPNLNNLHMGGGMFGDDYNVQNLYQAPSYMSTPMFGMPQMCMPPMGQSMGGGLGSYYNSILAQEAMSVPMQNTGGIFGGSGFGEMFQMMLMMKQMNSMNGQNNNNNNIHSESNGYRTRTTGNTVQAGTSSTGASRPPAAANIFDITDGRRDEKDFNAFLDDKNASSRIEYGSLDNFVDTTFEGEMELDDFRERFGLGMNVAKKADLNADEMIDQTEYTQFAENSGFDDDATSLSMGDFQSNLKKLTSSYDVSLENRHLIERDDVKYRVEIDADVVGTEEATEIVEELQDKKNVTGILTGSARSKKEVNESVERSEEQKMEIAEQTLENYKKVLPDLITLDPAEAKELLSALKSDISKMKELGITKQFNELAGEEEIEFIGKDGKTETGTIKEVFSKRIQELTLVSTNFSIPESKKIIEDINQSNDKINIGTEKINEQAAKATRTTLTAAAAASPVLLVGAAKVGLLGSIAGGTSVGATLMTEGGLVAAWSGGTSVATAATATVLGVGSTAAVAGIGGAYVGDAVGDWVEDKTGSKGVAGTATVASGALAGAAIGAAVGSIVPGIGTAIGAGVGAAAGAIGSAIKRWWF